jgi:cell division protein FtsB
MSRLVRPVYPRRRKRRGLRVVVVLFLVAATYALVFGDSGALAIKQRQRRLADLRAESERLVQRVNDLTERRRRLVCDDAYIETVAREELGMIRPGERVYRFR